MTSKLFASNAIEMYVRRKACGVVCGTGGRPRSLSFSRARAAASQAALRQIAFLDRMIDAVEALIAEEMLSSPEARRLLTVPGVKLISA